MMSVQINIYHATGIMFKYDEVKKEYDDFEPYMDSAFEGIKHHDGLCVLYDGMSGEYVFVGRIHRKTRDDGVFHENFEFSNPEKETKELIGGLIKQTFGLDGDVKTWIITHHR